MDLEIFRFSGDTFDYKEDASSKAAKSLLGGKGAALVVMAQAGMPVPPGFTIPTTACKHYMALDVAGREAFMQQVMNNVLHYMSWLESVFGYRPLVSVRSGAPISMPGMMDTILNVGLTTDDGKAWADRLGVRAMRDSQRRLIQMLGATGYGVPMQVFEFQLAKRKKTADKTSDTELSASDLTKLVTDYIVAFKQNMGVDFPVKDWQAQLRVAIKAVFESWNSERAIEYRKLNKIDDSMGTAVNIQAMVFGNMGDDSGSGVLFTRNPSTGEKVIMAEYLSNAQGEDVVAGIRTPQKLNLTGIYAGDNKSLQWEVELVKLCEKLETQYRDMVDVEFTVQKGELFILQSRTGKRSARSAFKIAVDLVEEGVIARTEALKRLTKEQYKAVRRPMIDPAFKVKPDLIGLPACPGVAKGRPVFSSAEGVAATDDVILVTHEASPNDIAGMAKAKGVLTQTGGATSHAAVVARAMDKPCVVGCTDLVLDKGLMGVKGGKAVSNEDITIDGATGRVWIGVDVPVIDASDGLAVRKVVEWCFELTGTCEIAPVDLGTVRPHRIVAAEWWGSEQVLEAVLKGLTALPIVTHVVLDLAPPKQFRHKDDASLLGAFGDLQEDQGFEELAATKLAQYSGKLQGLKLAGDVDDEGSVEALGFKMWSSTDPEALPADYVALQVLG